MKPLHIKTLHELIFNKCAADLRVVFYLLPSLLNNFNNSRSSYCKQVIALSYSTQILVVVLNLQTMYIYTSTHTSTH